MIRRSRAQFASLLCALSEAGAFASPIAGICAYCRHHRPDGQREAAEQAEAAAKAKAQRVLWQVVITSGPRVCVKGL